MANTSVALDTARTLLNDDAGTLWTDAVLLPKLKEAHREMQTKLVLAGIPVIKAATAVLSVPANTTDLTSVVGYPTDLIEPTWLKERTPGQQERDFVDMTEVADVPNLNPTTELIYWCWIGEKILLLGAVVNRDVKIRYMKGITVPVAGTSPIGFLFGESYLGHRTAALSASSVGNKTAHDELTQEANMKFQEIVALNIKGGQNLPARKRPYHRGHGRSRVLRDF